MAAEVLTLEENQAIMFTNILDGAPQSQCMRCANLVVGNVNDNCKASPNLVSVEAILENAESDFVTCYGFKSN